MRLSYSNWQLLLLFTLISGVIVGGLLLGTFFTLFVVPTVYSLLARRQREAMELDVKPAGVET